MGGGAHGGGDKAAHDYKSESSHGEAAPESHEHGHHDDHESGGPNWKGDVVQCCGARPAQGEEASRKPSGRTFSSATRRERPACASSTLHALASRG
jgi:hypothetical protein